jgi:hypothetical protein
MHPFFKRFFPTEINQRTDNDYFNKQPHDNATFSKSRPECKLLLIGRETGSLCSTREHSRADLFCIMKCKHHIWPAGAQEDSMRSRQDMARVFLAHPALEKVPAPLWSKHSGRGNS